jgi:hypothetical protein
VTLARNVTREAVGVDMSETVHGLVYESVQVSVHYVAVGPVYAVLRRAMIRHLLAALETERLGSGP